MSELLLYFYNYLLQNCSLVMSKLNEASCKSVPVGCIWFLSFLSLFVIYNPVLPRFKKTVYWVYIYQTSLKTQIKSITSNSYSEHFKYSVKVCFCFTQVNKLRVCLSFASQEKENNIYNLQFILVLF